MDERDEDSGSESEDEYGNGSDTEEDISSESESEDEGESPEEFLERIGADDHRDEITSQINPSDDPSLLNEDNKHYFTARALGTRRGMREGALDSDDAFDQLSGVIGGQLTDIGVREPAYGLDDALDEGSGNTDHNPDGTSSIQLPSADFAGGTLDSETVDTLYHESVHAEQWSLINDVRDGTDDDPSDRVSRLNEEFDPSTLGTRAQIQGEVGDAYRSLPSEQEAWQAAGDVKTMYENVGAMHDELEGQERGSPMDAVNELDERLEAQRQEILQQTPEQAQLEREYAQPEGAQ